MKDKPDSSKYDYQSEPGVTDATYQDFIAPLLAGLGVGKAVSASSRVIPKAATSIQAGLASKPLWKNVDSDMPKWMAKYAEELPVAVNTMRDIANKKLSQLINMSYNIGDWAKLKTYRFMKQALDNSQLSDAEIDDLLYQIDVLKYK
jgi:hypothetical protein